MTLRLPASRSPVELARAVRREAEVRPRAWATERALRRAGKTGGHVLLGPWLGEIGYELLYWIPFLRHALRAAGVEPEQATVLTRGGAGLWYRDLAAHELDVHELVPQDGFLPRLEERRARAEDAKQLLDDAFDRELVAAARERLGDFAVVHPSFMWARLRSLWFHAAPLDDVLPLLDFRRLAVERLPGLPADYIAVKAYFNECLPDSPSNRAEVGALVERLAAESDVVLLSTGLALDDHEEWSAASGRVHRIDRLVRPIDNLAVQSRAIAGAHRLVATYGGFSYLGPLLGVPTVTVHESEASVPVHLDLLRAAFPDASYVRRRIGETM